MATWRQAMIGGVRSGSIASVVSTVALTLCGWIERRQPAAPNNGPSQWVWGEHEAYETRPSLRHTAVGYGVHHVTSIFWAVLHEKMFGKSFKHRAVLIPIAQGLTTAAVASFVDYRLTPRRFRPGFEKHLSVRSLVAVYAAFGLGLAAYRIFVSPLCISRGKTPFSCGSA